MQPRRWGRNNKFRITLAYDSKFDTEVASEDPDDDAKNNIFDQQAAAMQAATLVSNLNPPDNLFLTILQLADSQNTAAANNTVRVRDFLSHSKFKY